MISHFRQLSIWQPRIENKRSIYNVQTKSRDNEQNAKNNRVKKYKNYPTLLLTVNKIFLSFSFL